MRFYFSLSYNDAVYKAKVLEKLNKEKAKYVANIGEV